MESTTTPILMVSSPENFHNVTEIPAGHHQVVEGGFLTGRNPFVFVQTMPLPTFIIQLMVIVCMSRLVKFILSPIKQPAVIAEIISGIILGPTVMGHIPYFTSTIFPTASLPFLNLMSNFGLVLFLFLVGLELDPRMLRKSIKKSLAISLAGMALPFCLGVGTSYVLFHYIEPASHQSNSFISYLLFLGVAMSITAFPVLARILTELNLLKTKVGGITISAAAVDDATSWCLLALVISIINANSNLTALYVFLMGLGYSIFLIAIVRPVFLAGLQAAGVLDQETPSQSSMFVALCIVFISAFITDAIGIHAIFGGFIAGIIMPHEGGFAWRITEKLEDIVQILFLPLYFALSGLKTKIGTLDDPLSWGVVLLVICAACCGKILGCTLAARMTKLNWRESVTVGTLMNCKGLVELIVLNLGYDAGVLSDKTFAIMVIMALVTTFITVPVVTLIYPKEFHIVPKLESHKKKEPSLLVSVNRIEQVGPLLSAVSLLQHKMNNTKQLQQEQARKGSAHSTHHHGILKKKPSFASLADLLHILPHNRNGKGSGVVINVLRLIELTARDSSVMLSASPGALTNDPITKLLTTFCEVSNKQNKVEGMVKVVTMEKFGSVMVETAENENAEYILMPWHGSGSFIEDRPGTGRPTSFLGGGRPLSFMGGGGGRPLSFIGGAKRRLSMHTPAQHSVFFTDLLQQAKTNVVIFVDRGGPVVTGDVKIESSGDEIPDVSRKQIYLPFFGGKDDREALNIVMGLGHLPKVRINVIRYKLAEGDRTSLQSGGSHGEEADDTIGVPLGQVVITVEDEDEQLLNHYFGGNPPPGGQSSTEDGGESGAREEQTVQYTEVESFNPVSKALQYLVHLSATDLVLFGRGNLKLGETLGIHFRNEDSERRKVLGDFAEAVMLCQCSASLMIVQSNGK